MEPRKKLIAHGNERIFAFLIDPSFSYRDLRLSLQPVEATASRAPQHLAWEVRCAFNAQARNRHLPRFTGRSRELVAIEGELLPADRSPAIRFIALGGCLKSKMDPDTRFITCCPLHSASE